MSTAFKEAHQVAGVLLSVAISAANKRVSVDAIDRGADGLPPSFGAVLVAKSVLLAACLVREGLNEFATATNAASDNFATVLETAVGNMDSSIEGLSSQFTYSGRLLNERFRGIEVTLDALLSELRNRPA